jgi:hypothetical protein
MAIAPQAGLSLLWRINSFRCWQVRSPRRHLPTPAVRGREWHQQIAKSFVPNSGNQSPDVYRHVSYILSAQYTWVELRHVGARIYDELRGLRINAGSCGLLLASFAYVLNEKRSRA